MTVLHYHLSTTRASLRTKTSILASLKSSANSLDHMDPGPEEHSNYDRFMTDYSPYWSINTLATLLTFLRKFSLDLSAGCHQEGWDLFIRWYITTKAGTLEVSQGIWMTRSPTPKATLNISAKTFLKTNKSLARHKRLKTAYLISLSLKKKRKKNPLKMQMFSTKHLHDNKKISYIYIYIFNLRKTKV